MDLLGTSIVWIQAVCGPSTWGANHFEWFPPVDPPLQPLGPLRPPVHAHVADQTLGLIASAGISPPARLTRIKTRMAPGGRRFREIACAALEDTAQCLYIPPAGVHAEQDSSNPLLPSLGPRV